MTRRHSLLLLLCGLGLALAAEVGSAQPITTSLDQQFAPFLKKAAYPGDASTKLANLRDNGITGAITPADKAVMDSMAAYLVYRLTEARYYAPPEPTTPTSLPIRAPSLTVNQLLQDARTYIHPVLGSANPDPGSWDVGRRTYVAEFGASLDKVIVQVMTDKNPIPILRLSAGRMLATVCESGAPAHWPTVLKLLTDSNLDPVVVYPTLKAAEALLGAYDTKKLWTYGGKPWVDEQVYLDLVKAVESFILKPPAFLYRVAGSTRKAGEPIDPKTLIPEEIAVINFYRVQAVRALGRIRYDVVGTRTEEHRPIYTLAKVAVADKSIVPAVTPAEMLEASIGLMTINPGAELIIEDLALAVAYGVYGFAVPKSGGGEADRSMLWKTSAVRLKTSMNDWKTNIQKNTKLSAAQKQKIAALSDSIMTNVVEPLTKPVSGAIGDRLELSRINEWIAQNKPAGKVDGQFFDKSTVKIAFPAQ